MDANKQKDDDQFIIVEWRNRKVRINKTRLKRYLRKTIIRTVVINVVWYLLTQDLVLPEWEW